MHHGACHHPCRRAHQTFRAIDLSVRCVRGAPTGRRPLRSDPDTEQRGEPTGRHIGADRHQRLRALHQTREAAAPAQRSVASSGVQSCTGRVQFSTRQNRDDTRRGATDHAFSRRIFIVPFTGYRVAPSRSGPTSLLLVLGAGARAGRMAIAEHLARASRASSRPLGRAARTTAASPPLAPPARAPTPAVLRRTAPSRSTDLHADSATSRRRTARPASR
jgi:hypothetical protein